MAEYIDISRIDDWDNLSIIDDDKNARYVYDIGELPRADVVERSEYDKMAKYLKAQIENKENNLKWNRDAFRRVVKRLDRLQRKIDDAYKKMESLRNQSVEECPLSEVGFRCGLDYAMDILVHDVGIGENNNENTK